MRSKIINNIVLMTIFLIFGCSSQQEPQLFVADNAFDVKTIRETDWHQQTTFKVKLEYPITAISKEILTKTEQAGWIKCADSSTKWESFIDESKKPSRIIHQQLIKFTKEDELVTVGMMYFSILGDMKAPNLAPDNTTQHVYIIRDDLSKMPLEFKQQYRELYGNCKD